MGDARTAMTSMVMGGPCEPPRVADCHCCLGTGRHKDLRCEPQLCEPQLSERSGTRPCLTCYGTGRLREFGDVVNV